MTVRVEVVTPCDLAWCGHETHRRSFTEWPPEAIEAAARAIAKRKHTYRKWDDLYKWETDQLIGDAAAALAAAWGHITGDNK